MANQQAQPQVFHIRSEGRAEGLFITPIGRIDEDSVLTPVAELIRDASKSIKIVLDLGHISRINSCGVREWILLMERISSLRAVSFVNISEAMIEQANLIPNLLGATLNRVMSFQAPYRCPACSDEMMCLLDPDRLNWYAGVASPPTYSCRKCGSLMEFDAVKEEYFQFLLRYDPKLATAG